MPGQKSDVVRVIPAGAPTEIGENHFINCFPESIDNSLTQVKRAYCVKRKGLKTTVVSKSGASGEPRGTYYWADTDYTFMVYGSTVYAFSSASSTVEQFTVSLSTSTGPVGFTECASGTLRKLFFCDGQDGYIIDSTAPTSVTTIDNTNVVDYVITPGSGYTDGTYPLSVSGGGGSGFAATFTVVSGAISGVTITNYGSGYTSAPTASITGAGAGTNGAILLFLSAFPVPHQPTPVFMDGVIALSKSNTTAIYACETNDYQVWKTSNVIYANQFPGNVTALARQQNYIFALKTDAVEYLYNAANAEGSIFSKTSQAATNFGCTQPATVVTLEDATIFVGKSTAGGFGVWKIENFKEEKLSTEYIDLCLNETLGLYNPTGVSQYLLSGSVIRVDGHRFYIVNELTDTKNSRALVYDLDEKFWSFWDSSEVAGARRFFGVKASTKNGVSIMQIPVASSTGKVLAFPTTSTSGDYNDNGAVYYWYYNSPVIDMDNRYRKRFNRVEVVGNKYSFSVPVTINYSDTNAEAIDKLSNTSWTVNMQTGLQSYLNNLGSSRSRIWQIGGDTDVPTRFENIEIFYNQGEH